MRVTISPPIAVITTTSQGGHFQNIKRPKATTPGLKSRMLAAVLSREPFSAFLLRLDESYQQKKTKFLFIGYV
jgi:hypothetical protein